MLSNSRATNNSFESDQTGGANKAARCVSDSNETLSSAVDQSVDAEQAINCLSIADESNSFESDRYVRADKARLPLSDSNEPNPSAADQINVADQAISPMSAADGVIEDIRYWHRRRRYAMDQRKRLDLALGAFIRMMLGWSKALPEAERKAIAIQAAKLIDDPTGSKWAPIIAAQIVARTPFAQIEKEALKKMEALAETLPVWAEFGEPIRGFGLGSLAVILAETGNLSNYATISKVWKRMGLAVMDGVRQGGLTKGAGAEAWIVHGYSPVRRSFVWNIGDTLLKGNRDGAYRTCYLARKDYLRARAAERGLTVAPAAKIPAKRRDEFVSDGHIHKDAQRYMEKRLLKHLWQAWRRTSEAMVEKPIVRLSGAESLTLDHGVHG